MANDIKIASVNCQGLGTKEKRRDVLHYLKTHYNSFNIICYQDTHFTEELENSITSQWGFKCILNSYKSNSRGVSIMFNNNFEFEIHAFKRDISGNLLALDITIERTRLTLITLYGPNTDDQFFLENLKKT